MTESKVVNRWIEIAVRERDLVNARELLIRLLNNRFPEQVSTDVIETINSQPNLSLLRDWFDQASKVTSFADFARILQT